MNVAPRRTLVSWRDVSYITLDRLGEGGSSRVYLALATSGPNKGVQVAIKLFQSSTRPGWRHNFMREVNFLRGCDHPAIMRVYDEGETFDGSPFIVSEFLPDNLKVRASQSTISEKISYILQLVSALRYLERQDPPVVHRDIKPANVFFKGPSCVLGDFGLVYPLLDERASHSHPPADHRPPEVAEMAQNYRTPELVKYHTTGIPPPPASDIFQLGLVTAELFTGLNPYIASGPDKPIKLRSVPAISGRLGEPIRILIEKMLVLATEKRASARELSGAWQELYLDSLRGEKPGTQTLRT